MILALVVGVLLSGRFRDRNQWMCSCYPLGCSSCCSRCRWSLGAKLNLTLDWGLVWSRGVLRREGRVIDIRKIGLCFRAQRYLYSKTSSSTCNSAPSKDSACVKNHLKRVKIFMSSKHSSTLTCFFLPAIFLDNELNEGLYYVSNKPNGIKIWMLLYKSWQVHNQLLNERISRFDMLCMGAGALGQVKTDT